MNAGWLGNFRARPSATLSNARYASMADGYDRSCHHILPLRALAIDLLDPQPGETVVDVACGTGQATLAMARRAGRSARIVGFEQSPQMLQIAERQRQRSGIDNLQFVNAAMADASLPVPADALLMSYTHDVLQDPAAIEALLRIARPGARYVVLGMRTLPWLWGWPVNLFVLWRARRYMTTMRQLAKPWRLLEAVSTDFQLIGTWHAGTSYLASGRLRERPPASTAQADERGAQP